jgi:hypothetical protein
MEKIEKRRALAQLDGIIEAADGVRVARGDLGVETDLAEIPLVQKARKCSPRPKGGVPRRRHDICESLNACGRLNQMHDMIAVDVLETRSR